MDAGIIFSGSLERTIGYIKASNDTDSGRYFGTLASLSAQMILLVLRVRTR